MKKKICGVLLFLITFLLLPVSVNAEEILKDNNCVLPLELYLTYDGNEKDLHSGYGILTGIDDSNGASNLIVNAVDVTPTPEELQLMYDEYAIAEEDREKVSTKIMVTVEKDIRIEATVNNVSNSMNLAILNLSEPVYNHNGVVFDVDEENVKPAQEIYILDSELNVHTGYAVNESIINGIKYIQFDSALDWEQRGLPIFNENEECIGMIQDSVDGTHKNALSSKEIVVVLKTLGISNEVADHTVKPIDKSILIAATDMAEKLDLTLYTEETSAVLYEQIQAARSIIIRDDVTQEEVDDAYAALSFAQDGLIVEEKMDTITLVFIIVSGVLVLAIIVFVIAKLILRKKKKKKEKLAAEIDAKRAPKESGPFVPSSKKVKQKEEIASPGTGQSDYLTRVRLSAQSDRLSEKEAPQKSEKLAQLEGFAPSSKAITFNEEDTTVLSAISEPVAENEKVEIAHLIIKESGDRISVDKDTFVLGKSEQKADYAIGNKNVSRAHLSIIRKNNVFYAMDMSSLNGSYLNGEKLAPQEEKELKNEDVIKLADEEMTFYTE